jgi:hypothetical protein
LQSFKEMVKVIKENQNRLHRNKHVHIRITNLKRTQRSQPIFAKA